MKKLAILFAATVLMASCTNSNQGSKETGEETAPVEAAGNVMIVPANADGTVHELTDAALYAPGNRVEGLTVLDFNAVWCGPCRMLAPVLEDMASKYKDKVTFVSVDVDKYGELMDQYDLGQSIPVVLFLRPDGKHEYYVGTGDLLPAEKFEALIEKNLK